MSLLLVLTGCAVGPGGIASWPVTNAEEGQLSGTIVDVLCEIGGNCADNCGEGTRQLGLKTEGAGTVLVSKNLTNYSGAADELWPYCGQTVAINGLFTEHKGVRFFQVQNVRSQGGQWVKANRYLEAWSERSGKSLSLAKDWQDHDARVQEILERDGRLGLGPDADEDYFSK